MSVKTRKKSRRDAEEAQNKSDDIELQSLEKKLQAEKMLSKKSQDELRVILKRRIRNLRIPTDVFSAQGALNNAMILFGLAAFGPMTYGEMEDKLGVSYDTDIDRVKYLEERYYIAVSEATISSKWEKKSNPDIQTSYPRRQHGLRFRLGADGVAACAFLGLTADTLRERYFSTKLNHPELEVIEEHRKRDSPIADPDFYILKLQLYYLANRSPSVFALQRFPDKYIEFREKSKEERWIQDLIRSTKDRDD